MKNILLFILIAAGVAYYYGDREPERKQPPGVLVAAAPTEQRVSLDPWKKGIYHITPLTTFTGRARIMEKFNPYFGTSYSNEPVTPKELSPYDLTLGWRELSDSANVDNILFNHGGKIGDRRILYFSWQYCHHPDYVATLLSTAPSQRQFDHLHIIPANKDINDTLAKAIKGDVVEFKGYISDVETFGHRDIFGDKGYSATENSIPGKTFWVTELTIEP